MEETKKPKMQVIPGKDTNQKYTYEELQAVCGNLIQENRQLIARLQSFNRLDYLFMVMQSATAFEDKAFVNACAKEIKDTITIPEETQESK